MDHPAQTLTLKFNPATVRKFTKWSIALLAFVGLLIFVPPLKSVIFMLILAFFLASFLNPAVDFLENHGIDRLLAVVFVFMVIIFFIALGLKFLMPVISNEIEQMNAGLENQSIDQLMLRFQERLGKAIPILANPMIQNELKQQIDGLLRKSVAMLVQIFSAFVNIVMLGFITFFFLKDGRRMKKAIVSWVPNRYFEMALIIIHKTGTQLGRYINGQLLVAFIVATLSIVALYLLHIRYYFFIGAIAGLANMIPYFGPVVGAVPAVLVALVDTGSIGVVGGVLVAFAFIQLFENVFISPFIVSRSVELHPLTVIIVILIGGQLVGIFGMLVAVPAASIIKVTVKELLWGFKHYRIFERADPKKFLPKPPRKLRASH